MGVVSRENKGGGFKDLNLEQLMSECKWDEAQAVAKQMCKICTQNEDNIQAQKYEEYMRRIEDAKRMEAD